LCGVWEDVESEWQVKLDEEVKRRKLGWMRLEREERVRSVSRTQWMSLIFPPFR